MKLSQKTINKLEHGDIQRIAVQQKISKPTIGNAFKGKECTRKTVDAINNYFSSL